MKRRARTVPGVVIEDDRVLVDERGWTGIIDAAADPDATRFAQALDAPEPNEITAGLHWALRAHIEASLGVDLAGRSADGTAVGAMASSDGTRSIMLLDTVPGRWQDGPDPVTSPDQPRQLIPGLASMLPVAMLDLMQVGPVAGAGLAGSVELPAEVVTTLLWRTGPAPTGETPDATTIIELLGSDTWRHWRVRMTNAAADGTLSEDGLDLVVLPEAILQIEGADEGRLEVREVRPVDVLLRLVQAIRPGLATGRG